MKTKIFHVSEKPNIKIAVRNVRLGYLISFLGQMSFTLSLWYVFGEQFRGWDPFQIFILFGVGWQLSFIFEVLMGFLADKFGRLRVFRASKLIVAVSYVVIGLSTNFTLLALAMLANAIGSAGISGSIEPVIGLSLGSVGKEDKIQKYQGHSFAISRIGRLIALILAPFLYRFWPPLIFLAYSVVCILSFFVSFKVKDIGHYEENSEMNIIKHLKQTLIIVKSKPGLTLAMFAGLFSLNTETVWFLMQPLGLNLGLSESKISLLFMVSVLITSAGAFMVHKIKDVKNKMGLVIIYNIFCNILGCLILLNFNNIYALIFVVAFTAISVGLYSPLIQTYFQHNMKKSNLSTCISIYYFVASLSLIFMNIVIGRVLKNQGLAAQLKINIIFGIICLVLAVPLIVRSRKDNKPIKGSVIPAE